jgi:hypothetical protein
MTMSRPAHLVRCLQILAAVLIAVLVAPVANAQGSATPARSAAQLEQLVAPIALYPDALLSQVLMASTYPLEVVSAARWSKENAQVTGAALEEAMQKQSWDPSVKSLTSVPQTLQMMNDKLDWTQQLGDAFLAQQEDVFGAVQRLRARADASGQLKTTEHQKVTKATRPAGATSGSGGAQQTAAAAAPIYTIEPVNPEQYYVPIYDPGTVYGAWPYPEYAPFYWTPAGYAGGTALSYAAAAAAGAAIWGGVDWWRNRVDVNVNNYNRFNRTNISNNSWNHNPAHRGAVPYRDQGVAQRFGDPGKAAAREAARGKADAGRRDLAGQGAKGAKQGAAAGRAAGAKQGSAASLGGAKQGAANRAGGAAAGGKAAQAKQAGATKKAAAGGNKAAQAKQAGQARSKQAAKPAKSARRPQAKAGGAARGPANAGAQRGARSGGGAMHARPAGMRGGGGGGGRGGARGGGGRRR